MNHENRGMPPITKKLFIIKDKLTEGWNCINRPPNEREIEKIQSGIYGMGPENIDRKSFNYDYVELDPSYDRQIISPFSRELKQRTNNPLVLDLGAGTGDASLYMEERGIQTIRADISIPGLIGQENAVQASAWKLPFPDNTFDGIHTKDMLTHIPLPFRDRMIDELIRITKPEAIILICSATQNISINYQYRTTREGISNLAEAHGLVTYFNAKWRSPPESRDWYRRQQPRFVIGFKKIC